MSKQEISAVSKLKEIEIKIGKAKNRIVGYDGEPISPTLICVSKNFSSDDIVPLLKAGQRVFGENRVQEAQSKWPALKQQYNDVVLHLIGPLQTNKVRDVIKLFDVIESVDREKLAKKLRAEMDLAGKELPCFVQVNIGQEEQKAGIAPEQTIEFVKKCQNEYGLNIVGLMCIPPFDEAPGPYFAMLASLAQKANVRYLSMGMSKDYEVAIMMGATHVRIGTALFGKRDVN
ncbi:MAG: YggS family pyridoxal phosphate-dependent enzyme [Devosiaceae bacterium]|nr:YggS family pyridoxal phosphate-dependent enzyme [Devosiaceae bacterium]